MRVDPVIREKIKADYLSGKGSIKSLSLKYGVSPTAMQQYSTVHKLKSIKDNMEGKVQDMQVSVSRKAMDTASSLVASRISSHLEAMISGSFALRKSLLSNLLEKTDLPPTLDMQTFQQGVKTLDSLDVMSRRALGLNDVQELKVSGSVEHTMSILQSCQKLAATESPTIDVEGLLLEVDRSTKD